MKILAIETSCDDTGISILEVDNKPNFKVLSNIVSSQIEIHKQYGGVFPAMAKREHQKNIIPVLTESLKESGLLNTSKPANKVKLKELEKILEHEPELFKKIVPFFKKYQKPDIDFITVTNGPGLEPCLWVGVNLAKALSYFWNIPVVPVNHIESHILVNTLQNKNIKFPAIALIVSGGHTQIILVKKIGDYKILGETRDDAAGECFDKAARILGLDYPGGPVISKLAETSEPGRITLPRPMLNTKDYDFSFSGL
jgi:N6-L-threonylcarbamoyladenine synthase